MQRLYLSLDSKGDEELGGGLSIPNQLMLIHPFNGEKQEGAVHMLVEKG